MGEADGRKRKQEEQRDHEECRGVIDEALADEALENVSGGMDLAEFCGCICADCGLTDMSVHHYYLVDDCRLGIMLCPAHAAQRRQKGQVLQELGVK